MVECIVCGSTEAPLLFCTWDRHYGIEGDFNIVCCASCELAWLDPMPTAEELTGYYRDDYYAYQSANEPSQWKKLARKLLRLNIPTHNPTFSQPGNFLDIGCGSGSYLFVMRTQGWCVKGVEPSACGTETGRQAGLDIFHGTLPEARFAQASFDYVRSNHSFEHMPNPIEILDEIYRILRPGGKLFVGVPNMDSLPFRLFGRYWWYMGVPVHTYTYSVKTIAALLERTGFRIERVHYNSNYVSLLGSLQIYINRKTKKKSSEGFLIRNPLLIFAGNVLGRFLDLIHQGDAIEVICVKPT